MNMIDVDDQPTPAVNLTQAHECAQLVSSLAMGRSLEITIVDVMNMSILTDKLNRTSNSNIKKHYWMTIDFYFCSVCYGEGIIMGLQYF